MHLRNGNFKPKMERLQIPQKLVYEKNIVQEKILRIRNCHHVNKTTCKPCKRHVNQTTTI